MDKFVTADLTTVIIAVRVHQPTQVVFSMQPREALQGEWRRFMVRDAREKTV